MAAEPTRFTPWSRLDASELQPPPAHEVRSVLVIGAGSSGLVAAKHLRDAGFAVEVLEKDTQIGGAFVTKAYDDGKLVSSKYLTAFSDLRSPRSDPSHLSMTAYVDYLCRYAEQEGLLPLIRFGRAVSAVERRADGRYRVRVSGEAAPRLVDAVCVCSGLHEVPYVPAIPGLDWFEGTVLHSSEYKDKSLFAGKRVLVVGCGETGMDLAYRAVQVASQAAMSIRNGFLSVPHEGWGGMPLDTYITNLFEHAYEHPFCHDHHFKWRVTTYVIRTIFFALTGCTQGYNQWVGGVREVRRGYHILCKSTAAMPYLNRPHKLRSWRTRLWARLFWFSKYVDPACGMVDKSILSFGAPASVRGRTVTFADGQTFEADVIVLATGYKQTFPFLHAAAAQRRDEAYPVGEQPQPQPQPPQPQAKRPGRSPPRARPEPEARQASARPTPAVTGSNEGAGSDEGTGEGTGEGAGYTSWRAGTGARGAEDPLPPEHFIVAPDEPSLAFVGFVRPNVGAIPPMAELQTMWWIERLRGRVRKAAAPPSYGLLGKKLTYGVDYGNYMHQLAAEIGAAPSLRTLWRRSPRALASYCLGQAYISFFRLEGPFASESAGWAVAEGELYEPVADRGLLSNAVFVLTMVVFGAMSVVAWALERASRALLPRVLHEALGSAAHALAGGGKTAPTTCASASAEKAGRK